MNKVALITGGSKGIGKAIASSMLAQGMRVAITSRSEESAVTAASELSKDDSKIIGVMADVRDLESQKEAVQKVISHFGQLDVLIANAGLGYFAPISELTPEQWNATIDTNLTGVFYSVKASLEALKQSKGYIITISSLAGANFFKKGTAYNASKFGLTGFTQALMLDLRQDDIKVTTIMPGSVNTYFGDKTPDDSKAWQIQPEDLGQMTVDLLQMHPRTLPSKVEVRPTKPPLK